MSQIQNLRISPEEARIELARRELARRRFKDYCSYIYRGYKENWHITLLAEALQNVYEGKIRFLIVELPPRHSKSLHVSQLFPSWWMGKDKDSDIIVASYSGDLAVDHGRETRNIIASSSYQNIFDTQLAQDSKAKGKWNTNGRGAYNAAGVGGSITGKGSKCFVIDDPFKDRKEADSKHIRDERYKWFRSVARTRLTPDGRMILMNSRWHEDDLVGRVIAKDGWVSYWDWLKGKRAKWVRLTLPAIAIEDEPYRKIGEVLWPQQYPMEEIKNIESDIGPYEFSSLYQQTPIDDASREIKKEWFKYKAETEIDLQACRKIATIDPGGKELENDYTGIIRNYIDKSGYWNVKGERVRIDSDELINIIFQLHRERFEIIGVEETVYLKAIKPFFEKECRRRGEFPNVEPLKHNRTQKEVRIRGLVPRYKAGAIYHIKGECIDLEEELLTFPKGTHDDTIDALAYQNDISPVLSNSVVEKQRLAFEKKRKMNQITTR